MNYKRISELKVKDGVYIPETPYTYSDDNPLYRMVPCRKVRDLVFDDQYPYLDESRKFKFVRKLIYVTIARGALNLLLRVQYGLKIEGREYLKKYRNELKDGAITVSNHCMKFDAVAVANAIRHSFYYPALNDLLEGSNWKLLWYFGAIPLAGPSRGAQMKFSEAFDKLHEQKEWIHVFPEARSWWFYKPVRPFAKGFFNKAYQWGCPIIPICISYRERKGIYKLFGKKFQPLLTVKIGEPLFPDKTRARKVEVDRLLHETRARIIDLAGIEQNTWPDTNNENQGR